MLDDLGDNRNGKIHIDLNFDHLLHSDVVNSSPVEQSQVAGISHTKQQIWEIQVQKAAETIVHQAQFDNSPYYNLLCEIATAENDIRPRVYDAISKQWILLDSGSAVTVCPKAVGTWRPGWIVAADCRQSTNPK